MIECPYVRDLIDKCEFDTIYHEHHCYFSVTALSKLFAEHGLSLNDVRRLPTHGGSLRLYVERVKLVRQSVRDLLREEHELGIDEFEYYQNFGERVRAVQDSLREMVQWNSKGRANVWPPMRAAAKGATLLNSIGIGEEQLDYVVDRNRPINTAAICRAGGCRSATPADCSMTSPTMS